MNYSWLHNMMKTRFVSVKISKFISSLRNYSILRYLNVFFFPINTRDHSKYFSCSRSIGSDRLGGHSMFTAFFFSFRKYIDRRHPSLEIRKFALTNYGWRVLAREEAARWLFQCKINHSWRLQTVINQQERI